MRWRGEGGGELSVGLDLLILGVAQAGKGRLLTVLPRTSTRADPHVDVRMLFQKLRSYCKIALSFGNPCLGLSGRLNHS
jgi:hypothetical protein